jgi:hypothetical protein
MEKAMEEGRNFLGAEVAEILSRPTAPVTKVGRVFYGLGPEASRAAAHKGDIKCTRVNGRLLALTAPLRAFV